MPPTPSAPPTAAIPATRADLMAALARLGIATTTVDHPPVFTVEESQAVRGLVPGVHTKNLFLKDKKGALFLVVAAEDARIDLGRLHPLIGASGRVSFGSPELLMATLGVRPGSVTAFAAMNDAAARVTVVLEAGLMAAPVVNAHPLENTASTTIASADLVAFLRAFGHEPRIVAFARSD